MEARSLDSLPAPPSDPRDLRAADWQEERSALIAESRRSIASLELAQEVAGIGSFALDVLTARCEWSRSLFALCGLEPTDTPTLEQLLSRAHPDDRERGREWLNHVQAGVVRSDCDLRLLTSDGGERHVTATAKPVRDGSGVLLGVVGTVLDVTERKRLELELVQAHRLDALGLLAAGVAHDFNNYLQVISGSLEQLEPSVAPGAGTERTRRTLHTALERCEQLVQQLLALSRRRRGGARKLDLNAALRERLGLVELLVGADVQVVTELHAARSVVEIDPAELEQIVMNLAANARDAMADGGTLTIRTQNAEPRWPIPERFPALRYAPVVRLSVEDSGAGVPESLRGRVFEPFFTTKEPGRGTGLGLPTVRWAVEHAGGAVDVDAVPGGGAVFHVYFPVVDAPEV